MQHTTKTLQKGNTVYLECIFRNMNGEATDPYPIPTYSITKESGDEAASGSLQKRKEGYFGTYFTPTEIGEYEITYSGEVDEKVVQLKSNFKVVNTAKTKS
jgi:hypothetical protein